MTPLWNSNDTLQKQILWNAICYLILRMRNSFTLPIIWLSFWWMSVTDMCILLYAVHLCYRGVIFKQLAKSNLILNVPGELVIIRDLVINTSLKWNILTYFPSCGFLYRYLKLGANIPDGTVKTTLCRTRRSRGLFKGESQLAFPPMASHYLGDGTIFQSLTLKLAGSEIWICQHYETGSQEH